MPFEFEDWEAVYQARRDRARKVRLFPARIIRGVFTDHKRDQIIQHWIKRGERAIFPDCPAPEWAYA